MRRDDFVQQQFSWFTGVVEDIADPSKINRVKVRPFGWYSDNKKTLPTSDLPWATVMMPSTSASFKQNGASHQLEVGSWVVGFFRDGPNAQDPMVMGSIASRTEGVIDTPIEHSTTNKVFKSQAGHLVEFENKDGDEKISITHSNGANITIDKDNNLSITNTGSTSITSTGPINITSAVKTTII